MKDDITIVKPTRKAQRTRHDNLKGTHLNPTKRKAERTLTYLDVAETTRHMQAFEFWFSLGGERTAKAVGQKFGVGYETVQRWMKMFNWEERLAKRNKMIRKRLDSSAVHNVVQTRQKFAKDIKKAIEKFLKTVLGTMKTISENGDNGKAYPLITDAADLEKMVKLYLLLEGEPTSKVANENINTNVDMSKQEIEDWLKSDTESQRLLTEAFRRKAGVAVSGQD